MVSFIFDGKFKSRSRILSISSLIMIKSRHQLINQKSLVSGSCSISFRSSSSADLESRHHSDTKGGISTQGSLKSLLFRESSTPMPNSAASKSRVTFKMVTIFVDSFVLEDFDSSNLATDGYQQAEAVQQRYGSPWGTTVRRYKYASSLWE